MTRNIVLSLVLSCACFSGWSQQADTVINRYRQYLFRTANPNPDVSLWIAALQADGRWPDIHYADTERADWKASKHLERVRELAAAWVMPSSPLYRKDTVRQAVWLALDHWLQKRYKNSNWWHNEIGVPRHMRDIMIFLKADLSQDRFRQCLEVLRQHRVQGNGNGANLIWSADLGLHYGALANDQSMMERCRDLILKEIHISTGEGVQPDLSFHQHGKRLQVFQYGKAYLLDNLRMAWELRGTPWAFPEEKVTILTDFVFKGWQWMARGINTVPGTMDRSVSRVGELRSPDIRYLIPFLIELCPEKTEAFNTLKDWQNGKSVLSGLHHWPYSDFTAYHRKDFSFFVKTVSSRTLLTESINNENKKGNLLNNGDAYLIRDGEEYFNLMPVWDWQLVPGVTVFKEGTVPGRQPFVGNVSNGRSGLTAMDYVLKNKEQSKSFTAHKIWALHDDVVVCLIGDQKTEGVPGDIRTAFDQCRWRGDVTVNKVGTILKEGIHELSDVKWIHHSGVAYIPFEKSFVKLHLEEATGTWQSINVPLSGTPVTEKIFMPVLTEPAPLQGQSTGYILAHCATAKDAARLADKPAWHILRNDKDCQAVSFKDGTMMAAFFSPSILKGKGRMLEVDKPCLVLVAEDRLYVSDPNHAGGTVTVKWNGKTYPVLLPTDGTTKEVPL